MKLTIMAKTQTNNFTDEKMMEKIKVMWQEATSKLETYQGDMYGVYYDYESNYKGDYSLAVAIPGEGSTVIELPTDQAYEVFHVDPDDEQGVVNTWKKIWELEEAGSLKRSYTYDFEKYDSRGIVKIHIAISN